MVLSVEGWLNAKAPPSPWGEVFPKNLHDSIVMLPPTLSKYTAGPGAYQLKQLSKVTFIRRITASTVGDNLIHGPLLKPKYEFVTCIADIGEETVHSASIIAAIIRLTVTGTFDYCTVINDNRGLE